MIKNTFLVFSHLQSDKSKIRGKATVIKLIDVVILHLQT